MAAKFSTDFWELHEGLRINRLTVSVLGATEEHILYWRENQGVLRHRYELLDFNSVDVVAFLSSLDAFLYKVRHDVNEACPVAVLEALAAGIPVVAEDRAGVADLIVRNATGFLCTTNAEYQSAIESLWRDTHLRNAMGRAARSWAAENVSLAAYRQRILKALT
jgi:glycosyltransferase involved in cell wall biosynthesis